MLISARMDATIVQAEAVKAGLGSEGVTALESLLATVAKLEQSVLAAMPRAPSPESELELELELELAPQSEPLARAHEQRMAAVGVLAAGMAHEINNFLSAVLVNVEWAAEVVAAADAAALPGIEELRASLEDAKAAGVGIRQIVRDLRVFSRPEDETVGAIDPTRVMDSAARMVRHEVRDRARIVKDYGPVPKVRANEARLGQVLLNLVLNAAQATPEGSPEDHEIRLVTATDDCGRAILEVHDGGCGISPEHLDRIFDPFFTTKPSGVGTGLGLPLCAQIVAGMQGRIDVKSTVGEGTTVCVVLPPTRTEPPFMRIVKRPR